MAASCPATITTAAKEGCPAHARSPECASTQNSSQPWERIFFISPQTRSASSKNALAYDECASGRLYYYIHADHLDTPRVVVDRSDNLRWRWMAEPFGTTAPENNPSGRGAFTFNLRFPGQFADAESGLNYNYFRDYDSSIGRYVQSDPIGLDGGINTFLYVGGNPVSAADPLGLLSYEGRQLLKRWGFLPKTPTEHCATGECAAGLLPTRTKSEMSPEACFATCFAAKTALGLAGGIGAGAIATSIGPRVGLWVNATMNSEAAILGSELMGVEYCYRKCHFPKPEICESDQLSNIQAP